MRNILTDLVRHTKDLFEIVKVTGTDGETRIQAMDTDKTMFVNGLLSTPQHDLHGVFGISNLGLLDGLLGFASYKGHASKFLVRREVKAGEETVVAFVFKDENDRGSTYRTMAKHLIPPQPDITAIPWTITVQPTRSKVTEFTQLARLYSALDTTFSISLEDSNLVFAIGDDTATTHHANMVFVSGVEGRLANQNLVFDLAQFLKLLKMTGTAPFTMTIADKVLGMAVKTPTGEYRYFLRAKR